MHNKNYDRQSNGIKKKYGRLRKVQRHRINVDDTDKTTLFKPNYFMMTDAIFRQRFSSNIYDVVDQCIVQFCLNTREKLHCIRHYAQLLCDFYCLKYEQDLWQTYFNVSILAGVWLPMTPAITKDRALENNLPRYLFTTRVNVEKRQQFITNQLKKIQHGLHEAQQQIDNTLVLATITKLVGDDLHLLRTEYEWEKVLFQYDANDYRLVKLFYECQPTQDQIDSAKLIWETTARQLKIDEHLRRTSVCRRTTHGRYSKSQIINMNTKIDEIMDIYRELIRNEKKKLFSNASISTQSPTHAGSVKMILSRQRNMSARARHLIRRQRMRIESDACSTM